MTLMGSKPQTSGSLTVKALPDTTMIRFFKNKESIQKQGERRFAHTDSVRMVNLKRMVDAGIAS